MKPFISPNPPASSPSASPMRSAERRLQGSWRWLRMVCVGVVSTMILGNHTVRGQQPVPEVRLAWDANTEADLAGYKVYYGTVRGAYSKTVDVGNTTTTVVSNLTVGTTYFFVVTAFNTAGLESLPSNEATFTPIELPTTPPPPVPEVMLAWDPNTEADLAGYKVYYGTASGVYSQTVDVGNATTAVISNLNVGTTYYFVVTAYNTAGLESLPSNEATFTPVPSTGLVVQSIPYDPVAGGTTNLTTGLIKGENAEVNGGYSFTVVGPVGRPMAIYGSTDLRTWQLLQTVANLTGKLQVSDLGAGDFEQRFYQALPQ